MPKSLAAAIRERPIGAFFLIAILLSFGLLFPAMLVPRSGTAGQLLGYYLGRLGVYSPVLAGILVAAVCGRGRTGVPFARRLMIFLPVWAISLVVHAADLSRTAPPDVGYLPLILISLPVAILPAYAVSSAASGRAGVREMLRSLVRPTGHPVYYLIALLAFPAIHLAGMILTNLSRGEAWRPSVVVGPDLLLDAAVAFAAVALFTGGINEEAGWRGFAQARLQRSNSPLVANLILWSLMVVWHIPNDIVQYREGGYLMVRIGLYPFITVLLGWVFNRTGGSILAPVLFHASMNSMNTLSDVLPMTTAGNVLLILVSAVAVLGDRMWRRLPRNHPAVHGEA